MSKIPPLGRPRFQAPPPPPSPPHVAIALTPPPQSDSDHNSDHFDPNRTPPPPATHLLRGNIPEEKIFEIAPQWPLPPPVLRPLTGRAPAPMMQTGIKRPMASGPKKRTRTVRQVAINPEVVPDPLEIIQTSLLKLSSYLDTLAAVKRSSRVPQPLPPSNPSIPRADLGPSPSPATLADLISLPIRSRKR